MSLRAHLSALSLMTTLSLGACFSGPSFDLHVQTPQVDGVEVVIPAGYTAHVPVVCSGADDVQLENAYIEVAGTAVRATDACTITLVNCQIISHGGVALVADGAGDINLEGCLVQGDAGAIQITGASDVSARNSTIIGAVRTGDAGDFHPDANTELRPY